MIPATDIVDISRLQFALTALYHFLFVPLTMGLSILLAIMESVYVMSGRKIWREMTQFWGILFGINFAMGVATGITMEFQFGTNWAYFSHYVGDVIGIPLAIEGMMAFFMEATFIGLFYFGWDKLSKLKHLMVTCLMAMATNLSALWILIANAWMQNPVGAHFNFETMRMEVSSFSEIFFNPVAQAKFVHTVSAGYVCGAVFVMAISAYYLLSKRNIEFAKRSMTVAASFGLASILSVIVLGDESGYTANLTQNMKLAAIEAMWDTEKPPASFALFGFPDQKTHETHYAVHIPYMMGIIATRTLDTPVPGINELIEQAKERIKNGVKAYSALKILQKDSQNQLARKELDKYSHDMGYGLLLKRYTENPETATQEQIDLAANDTVPLVAPLFWTFRIMVGSGMIMLLLFVLGFYFTSRQRFDNRLFLRFALYSLPLPWIASEFGWIVAEYGRQPWIIEGILPTFLATSTNTTTQVWTSLIGFVVFYSSLAVVDLYLIVKYARLGPDGLKGRKND